MDEKIVFRAGLQAGKEFPLAEDEITIGRELENNIALDDVQVSRNHMRIFRKEGDLFIEDLKSTNGTILNGKVLKKVQKLRTGDMVTLGENNIFEVQILAVEMAANEKPAKAPKRKSLNFGKSEKRSKEVEEMLENVQKKPQKKPQEEIEVNPQQEPKKKQSITEKYPKWAIILMIAIGFIIVFCLIPWVVIEVTDQWCNMFSGFFNSISPGVCP